MTATITQTITALPTPPDPATDDSTAFATKASAFTVAQVAMRAELNTFGTQANALAVDVNTNAGAAATSAGNAATSETNALASANTAVNAPGTSGTSTTSLTIGGGAKTLTTQTGKAWAVGQYVIVARTSDPAKRMLGPITAYNSGTGSLTVSVEATDLVGGGPFTDWTISLTADPGAMTSGMRMATIAADTSALPGYCYTLTASLNLLLPAAPAVGDSVGFRNMSGVLTAVIQRNGKPIMGIAQDMTLDMLNACGTLAYANATQGWILV